jgi:hypothetical protein
LARAINVDGDRNSRQREMPAVEAFALGQEYEARWENRKQAFSARLSLGTRPATTGHR